MPRYSNLNLRELKEQGLSAKLTPNPKKPRNNEESREQRYLFKWWRNNAMPRFGLNPIVMHSIPNGGFRNIVTASIMKAEGQAPGVFDVKLNVARKGAHGFWLEMKAQDGDTSDSQDDFREEMTRQGYWCCVCHSADEAIEAITNYLT